MRLELEIRLFAGVREAMGRDSVSASLAAGSRVRDLLDHLAAEHPLIGERRASLGVAVNHVLVSADQELSADDEVALIPPLGGG